MDNRIEDLTNKLESGLTGLYETGEYKKYLRAIGTFRRYSARNIALIYLQRENPQFVAGFNEWKKRGRFVRKGEKAIYILAPSPIKITVPVLESDGTVTERVDTIPRYRAVPVFEISQTEGDPLPQVSDRKVGTAADLIRALTKASPVPVSFGMIRAEGMYNKSRIIINPDQSPEDTVKTLAHEIAHALLHAQTSDLSAQVAELEAESVAYVVASYFRIDDDSSLGYVAAWAKEETTKLFQQSLDRIQKTAASIIDAVEGAL